MCASLLVFSALGSARALEVGEEPLAVRVSTALELIDGGGVIDWAHGVVETPGRAVASEPAPGFAASFEARRAAVEALREAVFGLRIHGDVLVRDLMRDDPEFADAIERIVRRADIVAERVDASDRLTAVARLSLYEGPSSVAGALLAYGRDLEVPAGFPAPPPPEPATGAVVVIDVRGMGLQPCLFPRFQLTSGAYLSTASLTRVRVQHGPPITYLRTRGELEEWLGGRDGPYLRATGVDAESRTEIVLDRPMDLVAPEEVFVLY